MRYLLFTVDYEIFGNGTGDVMQHMVVPAEKIARLGERFEVPITFFMEIEEYLAFRQYQHDLTLDLRYNPAETIRKQVNYLSKMGHEVQLHIHPQWHNAVYKNGRWIFSQTSPSVDELFKSQEEVNTYISKRKAAVEEMLSGTIVNKKICAYRAGAFCMQPAEKLLTALHANQLRFDSSVVKGFVSKSPYGMINYQSAPMDKNLWRIKTDVCKEDEKGTIYEVPIFSKPKRRINQLTPSRLKAKFSHSIPKENQMELLSSLGVNFNPIKMIRFLFSPVRIKLDFHNMTASTIMKWVHSSEASIGKGPVEVMVLIGHTKEHMHDTTLSQVFAQVKRSDNLKAITFSDLGALLDRSITS